MMDRKATAAVEPFVHAGYDLDAAAILLCESDGTPRGGRRGDRPRSSACCSAAGATRMRVSRAEAERLRFWSGRKNAFPAAGPHLARLLLHGRHHPAQARRRRCCRRIERDGEAVRPALRERVPRRRRQPAPADPVRRQRARRAAARRALRRRDPRAVRGGGRHHHRRARRRASRRSTRCACSSRPPSARRFAPSSAPSIPRGLLNPGKADADAARAAPNTDACTCSAASCRIPSCRASERAMTAATRHPRRAARARRAPPPTRAAAAPARRRQQGLLRRGARGRGARARAPTRGIVDYEPTELVVTARCGTPLAELEARARRARPVPGLRAAATSAPGSHDRRRGRRRPVRAAPHVRRRGARLRAGHASCSTGSGELLRFGGQVMKNVAGFDVSRLLCRLARHARRHHRGVAQGAAAAARRGDAAPRAAGGRRGRGLQPVGGAQPLPLSGAAWWQGQAWVRLSGAEPAVRSRARAHRRRTHRGDARPRSGGTALRHCRHPLFSQPVIWRLSVPATARPLRAARRATDRLGWRAALVRSLTRRSGGTCRTPARPAALPCAGAAAPQGRFHPLAPAVAELHRRLKARFDPAAIFNPGRLFAGL